MNYEIVTLEAKTVVGLTARTANNDPQMGAVIGGLWQQLYGQGIISMIGQRVNDHAIGLYSDYTDGVDGSYNITVGCEVAHPLSLPPDTVVKQIPAGRYAKTVVIGDQVEAVGKAWQQLWQLPLERTYTGDFEEYVSYSGDGQGEIHIYVAIQ